MIQYQILNRLGSGSYGQVNKVKHLSNHHIYAIKQIKMMQLTNKEKNNAINEVRLLASIDSSYIIKYRSAFLDEFTNQLCIVMEYADGGDLKVTVYQQQSIIESKRQKKYRFSETYIWKMTCCILKGLSILHSNGIIHRDIKSANVFIVNGLGKLGDLNVSRVLKMGQLASTQTGTPYYTSPEIWTNQNYNTKCDIWSLGCLIYEMCTLHTPFIAKDIHSLCRKVCHGQYPSISTFYSDKLKNFISLCLQVNYKKRPSAEELLQHQIFQSLLPSEEGQIDLLKTIKCPKSLKMLNKWLPEEQSARKLKTLKIISQPKEQKYYSKNKSMKKINYIKSPKNLNFKQKQNVFGLVQDDRVKLPRIASRRNIII